MCDAVEHLGSACRTRVEGPWGEREFEWSEMEEGSGIKTMEEGRGEGEEGGRRGKIRENEHSPSAEAVARCWPVESNAMSRISSSCPL